LTLLDEFDFLEPTLDEEESSSSLDSSVLKPGFSGPLEESSPHATKNAASKAENRIWERNKRLLKPF
jgi:hypothetical protein